MGTVNQHQGSVRRKLAYPSEDVVSNGAINEYTGEVLDELVTELNLSSQSWLVPRFIITVQPFEDLTPIEVADFGRVQFITTWKEGDSSFRMRYVPDIDEPNLVKYFGGGDPGPTGILHSAQAFALIFKDGQTFLRVAPIPAMAAEYQVIYEPSQVRPTSTGDPLFRLPQFDGYVSDLVAWRMLPYAGLDPDQRQAINTVLEALIGRGDLRFRRFKQSDRQNNNFRSIPFGARRWKHR